MKYITYLPLVLLFLASCSGNSNSDKHNPIIQQPSSSGINNGSLSTSSNSGIGNSNSSSGGGYHTDPNYKYEYRTGYTNNYEYNYDVHGSDQDGNDVSGNIDISGKYGSGTIEDESGNEKDIDVEWVDYGVMEGTDDDGNSYELEVDE